MTTAKLPIQPAPPRAPDEFTAAWANQLTRWLQDQLRLNEFPYLRGSGLYLLNLPTSGYGLKPGEVFSNDGVLTVVRENDIWLGSVSSGTELGTVAVTP